MVSLRRVLSSMSRIDRRYIFLVMAVAVVLPFLLPFDFTAPPSEQTIGFDQALEKAISDDGPVFMELAFGNQTMSEMEPVALAIMHHLFVAKKKVIFFTLYETAAAFTRRYLVSMEKEYGLTYGEDYVFLGFASAFTTAMYNMGNSVEEVFHEDDRGNPISKLPIMKGVLSLKDGAALIDVAANSNPRFWVNFAVEPHDITFLMATTAVDGPNYFPFLQTGQVKGLIAGGRAGAEYENMLKQRGVLKDSGDATRALGSQSLALLVIMVFIIIGNVGYFAGRKQLKK